MFSLLCVYSGLCKINGARKLTVCLSGFVFKASVDHRFLPVPFGVFPSLAHCVTTCWTGLQERVPPSSFLLSASASHARWSPLTPLRGTLSPSLWSRHTPPGHSPQELFPTRNYFLLSLTLQASKIKSLSQEELEVFGVNMEKSICQK